jgi:Fe-S cluster assembly protein SufD
MLRAMPATITETLDFAPTRAFLEAALDELDDVGTSGGGAVEPAVRRAALETYLRYARENVARPPNRRHDFRKLSFDDLVWNSGRTRVAGALPAAQRRRPVDEPPTDAPALAVENAGGLVHLGSTYLQAPTTNADPRITLAALADAKRAHRERVVAVQHRIAPKGDPFVALATAFQNCGAFVDVPAGIALSSPLQLVFTSKPGETSAVFPHVVVRLGAGAHATIVERHVGSQESFVCGIVEIELAANARCDFVVVQQADDGARVLMRRSAYVDRGAHVGFHVADLGGALIRTRLDLDLVDDRAAAEANVLFFARGFDHAELGVALEHSAAHTTSRTVVRSAATDRGFGDVAGTIRIAPDAHRADASFRSDALVLSRDAHVDAEPALAIETNDVVAYHAATIGSLDEEALFYVQTRGIARGIAQRMMALAFFEPALARFPSDALRDEIRTALDDTIDEGVSATFTQ